MKGMNRRRSFMVKNELQKKNDSLAKKSCFLVLPTKELKL